MEINKVKAEDWVNKWENDFSDSIKADTNSIKTLIFLTLLERQNTSFSYQDIAEELKRREVIEGDIDFVPLRNGMFQIVKALQTDKIYEIEKRKNGKEAKYSLKRRSTPGRQNNAAIGGKIVCFLDQDLKPSANFVAGRLMRDRRMPFYGIYLPMRAASRWVLYSEGEAKTRSKYEGEECERLLKEWLSKHRDQNISIIGLGVGEGIGEIEIIERLLSENHGFRTIHYCAIDTNMHLLLDHVERLNDKFKEEIEKKRLVCGAICGNFLENFSDLIQILRDEFAKRPEFDDANSSFLPHSAGTLISILGNVVGNLEQRASEWTYFQPILECLKGYDLAFLLGVSVQQTEQKGGKTQIISENYQRDLDDLLLATPRYLTHELRLLRSHRPEESTEEPEFILPEDDNEKEKRCPEVVQEKYQGDGLVRGAHVEGSIYEFFYTTQWDLSMKLGEEELLVPAGTNLLLYNIIKFDIKALIEFLESKGLSASTHMIRPYEVESGSEKRVYAVIALTNKATEFSGH